MPRDYLTLKSNRDFKMKKSLFTVLMMAGCLMFTFCSCAETIDDTQKDDEEEVVNPDPDDEEDPDDSDDPVVPDDEKWFKTRGLVASWSDVSSPDVIDYIGLAKANGINTFSIFGANRVLQDWKDFVSECEAAGISIEYEEHMMSSVLPRALFYSNPEYFRMNEKGERVNDANGCPSSAEALEVVKNNAKNIAKSYAPTNNKYYFWLDDGGGICHCEKCKDLNYADQALIYENAIIEAIKEINPDAQLAHLCYAASVDPPRTIKPHKDIFLEFAPFYRSMSHPLSHEWIVGRYSMTHGQYLKALRENLEVFPAETAQVLEYWMDDSLFSNWDPSNLVEVPWDNEIFMDDLKTYASFGIRNIMCYSVYVGPDYVQKFGFPHFLEEYAQGLLNYER